MIKIACKPRQILFKRSDIISVMYQDLWRGGSSIINLFEKMTSNVTKFKQSIGSSPSQSTKRLRYETQGCNCDRISKQRKLEQQFYHTQYELVGKASTLMQGQGQQTLSRLLTFMGEYILKIQEELSKELICQCKRRKFDEYEEFKQKISFLREENHKFFRMIEDKNQECQELKKQVELLILQREKVIEETLKNSLKMDDSKSSQYNAGLGQFMEKQLSSRAISSNSSRVSQFKTVWPQLVLPGEGTHRRYFQASPGYNQAQANKKQIVEQALVDINLNYPFDPIFRKQKIFNTSIFPK